MKYLIPVLLLLLLIIAPVAAVEFEVEYQSDQPSIISFECFNDMIFAGSANTGDIFYDDGSGWALANDTDQYGVRGLFSYAGYLYAGTDVSGKIYRTADGTTWAEVNNTASDSIQCFESFGSYIYAGSGYDPDPALYRSANGLEWNPVHLFNETTIYDLMSYGGYLYAATSVNGTIYYSNDGTTWTVNEDFTDTHVWCLEEYNGALYCGTGPNGKIYRSTDGTTWAISYDSAELNVYGLQEFDGALYAVSSGGNVFVTYDGTTWEVAYESSESYFYAIEECGDKLYVGSGYGVGKVYSLTSANATGGYGIQYPPHDVEFIIRDKYGTPLSGVTVLADPVDTTMPTWEWIKTLFGIDTEDVKIPSANMTGTTGADGAISFVMFETIQYELHITDATQGISDTILIYPKDEMYIITVGTTTAPEEVKPSGKYISNTLEAVYLNDTYVYLNFTYVDAEDGTSFGWWNVTDDVGASLETQNLTPSGGAMNESYGITLGETDDSYTATTKVYHPTYGWMNKTVIIVDHKAIDIGLTGTWKNFAAFALCCLVGLMFSRKSWKIGMLVTVIFAMALAQCHILVINDSYSNTMFLLGGLMFLSVILVMRGTGDR